jgi:hypothetical protein
MLVHRLRACTSLGSALAAAGTCVETRLESGGIRNMHGNRKSGCNAWPDVLFRRMLCSRE